VAPGAIVSFNSPTAAKVRAVRHFGAEDAKRIAVTASA
jgi:hypothetical protein